MTSFLSTNIDNLSDLYEQDYYLWLEATAKLLQQKQFSALDVANLLAEIEDMGRSEKRAVYSNLKILLLHLLKYKYQPENRSNSWQGSIVEHRQRLKRALKESPSLQPYFVEIFDECYQEARELAAVETGIEIAIFPADPPFAAQVVLDATYLPESDD